MSEDRKLAQELEFLQADQELLRQEVDSMNHSIKVLEVLLTTLVINLKNMLNLDL